MKKLEKIIKDAIISNKCKIGTRQVMNSIKGSRLIIISNSLLPNVSSKIMQEARSLKVQILEYDGNSVQLGRLCNKPFRISTISLKIGKDNDIEDLLKDSGD